MPGSRVITIHKPKKQKQKTAPGFPGATTCAKKYKGNLEKFVGRTMVIEIP